MVNHYVFLAVAGQILGFLISIALIWAFLIWRRYVEDGKLIKLVEKIDELSMDMIIDWTNKNKNKYPLGSKLIIAHATPYILEFLGIDNRSEIVSEKDIVLLIFEKRTMTFHMLSIFEFADIDPQIEKLIEKNDGFATLDI